MTKLVGAVVAAVLAFCWVGTPDSAFADDGPTGYCVTNASSGLLGGVKGILVDGKCEAISSGTAPSGTEYRTLSCLADGAAIVHGTGVPSAACDPGIPQCMLLVEGGQSGANPVLAFEDQMRKPGAPDWTTVNFWCPQSTAPVPAAGPDVAAIRDRVVRLLPRVAAATTGPNTLVNIQTLLWAATPERRSLGRVTVVGQPVWLQIVFDHATWDFGDGTHASSDVPGKAYDATNDPCRTVACPHYFGHTFSHTGVVHVSVQISWRATYALDGQHYQPVDNAPITGPTSTVQIHVRQARGILVSTGD